MGTKNNPSQFDCYTKADPDEPIFTLRAKDPLAPTLIRMWVAMRSGNVLELFPLCAELSNKGDEFLSAPENPHKIAAARNCANAMENYREDHFQ